MLVRIGKVRVVISVESFSPENLKKSYESTLFLLTRKVFESRKFLITINCIFDAKIFFLPTKIVKYTLNKSPHVNKKAREQFETRIYRAVVTVKPLIPLFEHNFLVLLYYLTKNLRLSNAPALTKSRLFVKQEAMNEKRPAGCFCVPLDIRQRNPWEFVLKNSHCIVHSDLCYF